MNAPTDRTWDVPNKPWVMKMTWSELLFAHWPVAPTTLASLLPQGLELDTRDGIAWIGVVPFEVVSILLYDNLSADRKDERLHCHESINASKFAVSLNGSLKETLCCMLQVRLSSPESC